MYKKQQLIENVMSNLRGNNQPPKMSLEKLKGIIAHDLKEEFSDHFDYENIISDLENVANYEDLLSFIHANGDFGSFDNPEQYLLSLLIEQ